MPIKDVLAPAAKLAREAEMAYALLTGKGYTNVAYLDATVKVDPEGRYLLND